MQKSNQGPYLNLHVLEETNFLRTNLTSLAVKLLISFLSGFQIPDSLLPCTCNHISETIFHFSSCSVLLVNDKESVSKGRSSSAEVKLVDFAHVVEGKGIIDHNFLGGLCSFIKFISEI
jgi:hypothetical protein